jgi:hypothetical protein
VISAEKGRNPPKPFHSHAQKIMRVRHRRYAYGEELTLNGPGGPYLVCNAARSIEALHFLRHYLRSSIMWLADIGALVQLNPKPLKRVPDKIDGDWG